MIDNLSKNDPSADTFEHESQGLSDSHAHQKMESIIANEQRITKNIAFWNALADSRLESTVTVLNLFILLMILTLVSSKYNGPNLEGLRALGWITCSLVIAVYIISPIIKICYVPHLQQQLKENTSEGFKIYEKTHGQDRKLEHLPFKQLILVDNVLEERNQDFRKCFPSSNSRMVFDNIRKIMGEKGSRLKIELEELKQQENQAKWWQAFWQVYVVGKTFSIPSICMLVFIITPLSNATKTDSLSMNNAQGWLAVGFLAVPTLIFILIKCCLWDRLNRKVKENRIEPFEVYSNVYINHTKLEDLSLSELQDINKVIEERGWAFQKCFSQVDLNEVRNEFRKVIASKLSKKTSEDQQLKIMEIVQKANQLNKTYTTWLNAFNTKIVGTIITFFKFFIVMAITFVQNYPDTSQGMRKAQQAVGIISLIVMVIGYLYYLVVGWCMLGSLESEAKDGRASPFTTFRLVYFGYKSYVNLQVHELEDIVDGIQRRREEFVECFPKANLGPTIKEIRQVIAEKKKIVKHHEEVYELIQEENQARKRLQFWTSFTDGPVYAICYSFYVQLVVMVVSLTAGDANSSATMGWIGLGLICVFITFVTFFKCYVLEHLAASYRSKRVDGFSQFNLVFLKKKELKDLSLHELQLIQKQMDENPVEFKKCFTTINFQETRDEVHLNINVKKGEGHFLHPKDQVEYQNLLLRNARATQMLAFWKKFITERLYPIMPIAVILEILWVQSIAVDKYGITVGGFLGVAIMAAAGLLILFYKLYLEGSLESEIKDVQLHLRHSERKRH